MHQFDIIMRELNVATQMGLWINKNFNYYVKVLDPISPFISKSNPIILDAHFKGNMINCKGINFINEIRLDYGNFNPILLLSWLNQSYMETLDLLDSFKLNALENNSHIVQFPLSQAKFKRYLKSIENGIS